MSFNVTILGCGSSSGTPAIGCTCRTCLSDDPRNQRTRASSVVEINGVTLLIDTSSDLRQQALRAGLTRLDAVLYTHPHADHLNGIDDLRAFCYLQRGAIPLFGNPFTMRNIHERFDYCFLPPGLHWDKPVLEAHDVLGPFSVRGVTVTPIPLLHGRWPIYGWRIGRFAYLTDVSTIPEESWPLLRDLDLLLLDCLKMEPYPTHFGFHQALDAAQRIGARRTVLIHMTHELEYHATNALCPAGVELAYDGLRIAVMDY